MYVKIHKSGSYSGNREVVAVCDENLLGKILHGDHIDFKVSESFYKGERKAKEEVIALLKKTTNINLVGKEAVAAGIKAGIISQNNVIMIEGVPHAQAFTIL